MKIPLPAALCCLLWLAAPATSAATASSAPPDARRLGVDPFGSRPALPSGLQQAAAESLHTFDVMHYRLDLSFPCVATNLSGTCRITLRAHQPLPSVQLDFATLNADSVSQDGVPAAYAASAVQLDITLPRPLAAGDTTVLTVAYHGPAGLGFYQAAPETWFTFSEPSTAHFWFPCYDQPWDKATSEIHATVPDTMFVASNGIQTAPPTEDPVHHTKTWHWGTNYPITTYLMSVAIGNYVELRDSARYVPVRNYVLRQDSANAVYDFHRLPEMIDFFGSLWGQYPFEKYGMAATRHFGGGMEHQTMTTITRDWITGTRAFEGSVAHELAHQWWGDMVTCLDWPHIWVNEGFASYADILFTEHAYGADSARVRLADWARTFFNEDSIKSYPIYDPPPLLIFGLAEYYKGAWVLHMLRHLMGDSAFVRGWRNYGQGHKYGNGTIWDFQAAEEAEYGASLEWFFDEWVVKPGYPRFRLSRNSVPRAAGGYYDYVTLQQVQPPGVVYDMPVDLLLRTPRGDTLVTVRDRSPTQAFEFVMAAPLDSVTLDPGRWLLYRDAGPGGIVTRPGDPLAGGLRIRRIATGRGVVDFDLDLPQGVPGQEAELSVYDLQGRLVATPWRGGAVQGGFRVRWNGATSSGSTAGSGIYFARLGSAGVAALSKFFWIR